MRGLGSRGGGGGGIGHRGSGILLPARRAPDRRSLRLPAASPRSLPHSTEFAVLGLTPFASPSDVKRAYKRLALKYHPDVIRAETGQDREEIFKDIKSAYESLMVKFEENTAISNSCPADYDEWDEWDEWMGFEGGTPVLYGS